jgi:hypothetical protein
MHPVVATARQAEEVGGAVCDHLVHVHMERSARAGLEGVHDELAVQPSCDHVAGGAGDGANDPAGKEPQFSVGERRGQLDLSVGADQGGVRAQTADGEIGDRAGGLGPEAGVRGHPHRAEGIPLAPSTRARGARDDA